jgi:hypothetical protein
VGSGGRRRDDQWCSIVACIVRKTRRLIMRYLMVWLALLPTCALAQGLSVKIGHASRQPLPSSRRLLRLRSSKVVWCRPDSRNRSCITSRWKSTPAWPDRPQPMSSTAFAMACRPLSSLWACGSNNIAKQKQLACIARRVLAGHVLKERPP